MQLKKRVDYMLKNMNTMLKAAAMENAAVMKPLSTEIEEMRKRLDQPLKVAVVGFMKAGKSTLMNSILREKVLFTGNVETTYTVSWFKYGEAKRLSIILRDDRVIEAPYEDLAKWTVRSELKNNPQMNEVKYIVIYYPNEILKTMELIDTPGLFSSYEKDSDNTLDFLGLQAADKITSDEAAAADAIIYTFSSGVKGKDADILDAFSGTDVKTSSPINAVGVFTRTDIFWDPLYPSKKPKELVANTVSNYRQNPRLKELLYTILPVSAKLVECASDIDASLWDIFQKLAAIDEEIILDYLSDASAFSSEESDELPVPAADRARVLNLFSQYGVYMIIKAIHLGIGQDGLIGYLFEESGVKDISDLIIRHFGNRSYIIKLNYVLTRLEKLCAELKQKNSGGTQILGFCNTILEELDRLRMDEHIFKELTVLQGYYRNELKFPSPDYVTQLLQITGEYGANCEARLGTTNDKSIIELRQIALERAKYWNDLGNGFGISRQVSDAAKVIARSCEIIFSHLDALAYYNE
jgi:GTPase SAR1 family protein